MAQGLRAEDAHKRLPFEDLDKRDEKAIPYYTNSLGLSLVPGTQVEIYGKLYDVLEDGLLMLAPLPASRVCKCGCGKELVEPRRGQRFFDIDHYDDYRERRRKERGL